MPIGLWAQDVYKTGLFPQLNLDAPLKGEWELSFRLRPRYILFQGSAGDVDYRPEYERTDFETVMFRGLGSRHAVGAGYMVRHKSGMFYHRSSQQFSSTYSWKSLGLGHRTILDQTFGQGKLPVYRFRFRLFAEIPVQGQDINPGKLYLKLHSEALVSWEGKQEEVEVRGLATPGLKISENTQLECGLDYRLSNLLQAGREHQFWLCCILSVDI